MTQYRATLIISFYNRIDYLKRIIAALERQSMKDFEVAIADDGSREEVVAEIRELMGTSPIAIQHLWHEDLGFRKTRIFNRAVLASRSDYLIFIDGDCLPHPRFIEEHYRNREAKTVLAGRRVNVSPKFVALLTEENIRNGILERGFERRLLLDGMFGKSTHVVKGVFVQSPTLRRYLNRKETGLLGCNFSIHKSDLLEVNGFDERYEAPAVGEDTDLEVRLKWNGVKLKTVKNMAIQYHFDHPKLPRPQVNFDIFEKVLRDKKAYTSYGIVRLDPAD